MRPCIWRRKRRREVCAPKNAELAPLSVLCAGLEPGPRCAKEACRQRSSQLDVGGGRRPTSASTKGTGRGGGSRWRGLIMRGMACASGGRCRRRRRRRIRRRASRRRRRQVRKAEFGEMHGPLGPEGQEEGCGRSSKSDCPARRSPALSLLPLSRLSTRRRACQRPLALCPRLRHPRPAARRPDLALAGGALALTGRRADAPASHGQSRTPAARPLRREGIQTTSLGQPK